MQLPAQAPSPPSARTYYNVSEVARLLGVSRVSVWRWISSGRLPVARLGHRTVRIRSEDVDALAHAGAHRAGLHLLDPAPPGQWLASGSSDHAVLFYEAEPFLLDSVAEFLAPVLHAGDRIIVVATPAHRAVVPAESYSRLRSRGDRLREISALQQKAASLELEVTARRRMADQLEHALQSERSARAAAEGALQVRDEFLSMASHELRTPLAVVSAQAQLCLRRFERTGDLDEDRVLQALRT